MKEAKCLVCSHSAAIESDLSDGIYRCDECGARMVYGELAPRIVVEPEISITGRPLVAIRIQDARTREDEHVLRLDPQFAASVAKNILSLVIP
jgi:hypothetical protein